MNIRLLTLILLSIGSTTSVQAGFFQRAATAVASGLRQAMTKIRPEGFGRIPTPSEKCDMEARKACDMRIRKAMEQTEETLREIEEGMKIVNKIDQILKNVYQNRQK